jgi:hypothetical protein
LREIEAFAEALRGVGALLTTKLTLNERIKRRDSVPDVEQVGILPRL